MRWNSLLLVFSLLAVGAVHGADGEWDMIKDKDGIQIYTLAEPESGMVAAKHSE